MKGLVREYSVVAVLIAVGIAGYLFYWNYKQDILAYSLDAIGGRLVAMVDDPSSRAFIAERFAHFKGQVLAREVSPSEVEHMAANVLNLSNSGSTLTPEEAELVLRFAAPEARALPAPGAPDAAEAALPSAPRPHPAPVAPEALDGLARRLHAALALDRKVQEVVRGEGQPGLDLARTIRFGFDGGLHVDVDSSLVADLRRREFEQVARELVEMEKHHMVVWKKNLPARVAAAREHARHEADAVAALRAEHAAGAAAAPGLASLEALRALEAKGYAPRFDADSLHRAVRAYVEAAAQARREVLEAQREGVRVERGGESGAH